MVAGLYDASLDQYLPHDWLHSFSGFRQETSRLSSQFENSSVYFSAVLSGWTTDYKSVTLSYRQFPDDIVNVPRRCVRWRHCRSRDKRRRRQRQQRSRARTVGPRALR